MRSKTENQVQPQTNPVQPERTPQQADQARQQDNRSAEGTRINPDWTTRQRDDARADMERQRRMDGDDRDRDNRTVGRNWRRDEGQSERGPGYGSMDRDGGATMTTGHVGG
jgi:hypothetical protein